MNSTIRGFSFSLLAFSAAICVSGKSWAQDAGSGQSSTSTPVDITSPLYSGSYVAPLASYQAAVGAKSKGPNQIDHGDGGLLMFGFRKHFYALEAGALYTDFSGPSELGVQIHGLVFPFKARWIRGVYGIAGIAYEQVRSGHLNGATNSPYTGSNSYGRFSWDAGIGNLLPLHVGNYKFAIRTEARYRYSRREPVLDANQVDFPAPRNFNDAVVSIGLQLPLSFKHDSASAPLPPPVEVVPVEGGAPASGNAPDASPDIPGVTSPDAAPAPAGAPSSTSGNPAAPAAAPNPAAGRASGADPSAAPASQPAAPGDTGQGTTPAPSGSTSDIDSILGSPPAPTPAAPAPNKQ